ncbi:hypothetical protein D3C76_1468140 [compost metagenome]
MFWLQFFNLFIHYCNVGTLLQMVTVQILKIDRIDMLAAGKHDIFSRSPFKKIQIVMIML